MLACLPLPLPGGRLPCRREGLQPAEGRHGASRVPCWVPVRLHGAQVGDGRGGAIWAGEQGRREGRWWRLPECMEAGSVVSSVKVREGTAQAAHLTLSESCSPAGVSWHCQPGGTCLLGALLACHC